MSSFGLSLNRAAASTTLSVGSLIAAASNPRRYKLFDWGFGSAEGTVGDGVFEWEIQRCTAGGTNTAVTVPAPIDPGDTQAATTVAGQNHTVDATVTANQVVFGMGLNQRASFRWVPAPGKELIIPATASNGFAFRTPVASAAVAARWQLFFEEQ